MRDFTMRSYWWTDFDDGPVGMMKLKFNDMKKLFFAVLLLCVGASFAAAQPDDVFVISINDMSAERQRQLNDVAAAYRNNDRSVLGNLGKSMLTGGFSAVVNVMADEIVKLTKIRSVQKKKWLEMRNNECVFVDSLESIKGQCDFYAKSSHYGPLDPSDMRFDGITFTSSRNGQEVLRMVCRLDTARLDQMFRHSKFHLVLDSLVFHPYNSYLPNLSANRIVPAAGKDMEYYEAIRMFSYDELGTPTITIKMDLTSSWINEQVQVYQDVKLGSFTLNVPIPENAVRNSVFTYSRKEALETGGEVIEMNGDCFVVPRSYMPGAADNPSWGTGEYKMKVVMTQKARYRREGRRSKNWHKDYKELMRLQNGGKAKNDYWTDIKTTFTDKSGVIMKAIYMPAVNLGVTTVNTLIAGDKTSGTSK